MEDVLSVEKYNEVSNKQDYVFVEKISKGYLMKKINKDIVFSEAYEVNMLDNNEGKYVQCVICASFSDDAVYISRDYYDYLKNAGCVVFDYAYFYGGDENEVYFYEDKDVLEKYVKKWCKYVVIVEKTHVLHHDSEVISIIECDSEENADKVRNIAYEEFGDFGGGENVSVEVMSAEEYYAEKHTLANVVCRKCLDFSVKFYEDDEFLKAFGDDEEEYEDED